MAPHEGDDPSGDDCASRTGTARPLTRAHMPGGDEISLARYTRRGTEQPVRLPEERGPEQSLAGFDEVYTNIVDYIVRITHRIWEQRDVEYIRDCYAAHARVFDDYGLQIGAQKIVADTHHTTAAFSDIVLDAEEVIWAGNDEIGFHTSHRVRITGTNDGPSRYGPATGRRIDFTCIANCVAQDNLIFLEHVCYNTAAMLAQLGRDPCAMARALVSDAPPGWPRSPAVWNELRASVRPKQPLSVAEPVEGFDPDAFVRTLFEALWNARSDTAVADHYAPDIGFEGPGGRAGEGAKAYAAFIAGWLDRLTDARLQVDEVYWMPGADDVHLVSIRWSLEGSWTNADAQVQAVPVQLWGITQQEIRSARVAREWMLCNELDLLMQLEHARQNP